MNKQTGIIVAVALAVAAVLYLVFTQKKTPTVVSTSIGSVPVGALTSLLPLPAPGTTSVSQQIAASQSVLDSGTPLCASIPSLNANDLVTPSSGVCALTAPCGVVYD